MEVVNGKVEEHNETSFCFTYFYWRIGEMAIYGGERASKLRSI
jgi:hypothetical protein